MSHEYTWCHVIWRMATKQQRVALVKKTCREKTSRRRSGGAAQKDVATQSDRMPRVSICEYERMTRALDQSLAKSGDYNQQPLVLAVRSSDECHYFLSYFPSNARVGLRLLQQLYVLPVEEHSALIRALCNTICINEPAGWRLYDDCGDADADADAILMKYCGGTTDVGRCEYTLDIDFLSHFGQELYVQQCHVIAS